MGSGIACDAKAWMIDVFIGRSSWLEDVSFAFRKFCLVQLI
jgi:hypothetical protein